MSSNSLFQILEGLNIDGAVSVIHGSGAPSVNATVGSVYLDNLNGVIYLYDATGSAGNPGWIQYASQSYVTHQIAQAVNVQLTWRPPVELVDTTITTLPTGSASSPVVIDGVSISNNQRVLFAALTTNPNVYIYDETTGAFTQDTSVAPGDTVYVINTGQQYTYSEISTSWVLSNLTTLDELNYIREFIGKTASGSITPVYTSTNFVTGSPNLEDAIALLDSELGANVKTSSHYIAPSGTVNGNIQSLDAQVYNNTSTIESLSSTVTNLVTGGGGSGTGSATISGNTISETTSGTIVLDTVTGKMAKWVVYVNDSTSSTLNTAEILAIQNEYYVDGSGNHGDQIFITTYGVLETNGVIPGLQYNVSVPYFVSGVYSGLQLSVTANDPISATVFRILEG
jgi:hypothetical protein